MNKCNTCKIKNCKIKPKKGNMIICCNYSPVDKPLLTSKIYFATIDYIS